MKAKETDYLNIHALLEAARNGYFKEQLELQRANKSRSGIKTEDYCREFCKVKAMQQRDDKTISVSDVERKHFHGDY